MKWASVSSDSDFVSFTLDDVANITENTCILSLNKSHVDISEYSLVKGNLCQYGQRLQH